MDFLPFSVILPIIAIGLLIFLGDLTIKTIRG